MASVYRRGQRWTIQFMGFRGSDDKRRKCYTSVPVALAPTAQAAMREGELIEECIRIAEGGGGARRRAWGPSAEARAREYLKERGIALPGELPAPPLAAQSLGPAVEAYLADRADLKPKTLQVYRLALAPFVTSVGAATHVSDALSDDTLRGYARQRAAHFRKGERSGERARNLDRQALSAFASWCEARGLIAANIVRQSMPHVTEPRRRRQLFTPAEVRALLAAGESPVPRSLTRWGLVLRLLLETGIRFQELTHLRWQDVDVATAELKIQKQRDWTPKTKEERAIALLPETLAELQAWRAELLAAEGKYEWKRAFGADAARLVTYGHQHPTAPVKDPEKIVRAVFAAAGVPWRGWHVFRHTFAVRLAMDGAPPMTVMRLLGHASLATTMIYFRWAEEERTDADARARIKRAG